MSEYGYADDEPEIEPQPELNIDFDVSPSIAEVHAAFALGKTVTLVTEDAQEVLFKPKDDLGEPGWLSAGVPINANTGEVNVSTAPNFAFYEGLILTQGGYPASPGSGQDGPWILLIEPHAGLDEDQAVFYWNGGSA